MLKTTDCLPGGYVELVIIFSVIVFIESERHTHGMSFAVGIVPGLTVSCGSLEFIGIGERWWFAMSLRNVKGNNPRRNHYS